MKNTPLIISIIALVGVIALGVMSLTGKKADTAGAEGTEAAATAEKGSIVYFNIDRVLSEYDMANDLRSVVESKAQGIQEEMNRRGNSLTRSTAEIQGQNLEKRRNDFNEFANQKNQEIAEEQQVMMNNIGDAIKQFLDKYTVEKHYSMVIATSGDILPSPVAAADSSLDVTDDIITRLNDEYVKNKSKNSSK